MNFVFEPWHWFVLGIILILSEFVLPAFAALWFGVAAILVAFLLWIFPDLDFVWQMLTWIVLSIACTVAWFKYIKPLSIDRTKAGLPREATIGQTGMVIQLGPEADQVRVRFLLPVLGSDEWNCKSMSTVQVGDRVKVIDILGNELVVQSAQSNSSS